MKKYLAYCFILVALLVLIGKMEVGMGQNHFQEGTQVSPSDVTVEKATERVIWYKEGKSTDISVSSKDYVFLKEKIEAFVLTADSSYKLFIEASEIEDLRKSGEAIELIYASPKEMHIQYLSNYLGKESVQVSQIVLPLSTERYPGDMVFFLTPKGELYYLANSYDKTVFKQLVKELF